MSTNISDQISWLDRSIKRFHEVGTLIPFRQRKLYEKIRDEFAGGRTVIDIGCSIGIGTNILSHEARFVWGIDVNKENVEFAKQALARPNMDFEVINIENPPTRGFSTFEVLVMSECIEHLNDVETGLSTFKRFMGKDSIGFITCPNGNNQQVVENENKHGYHIQHWKAGEFYELMTKHFQAVTLYSVDKLDNWGHSETIDGNADDYLIVAKVEGAK